MPSENSPTGKHKGMDSNMNSDMLGRDLLFGLTR